MLVKVLRECGYEEALLGLSLSYFREGTDLAIWWTEEKREKAIKQSKLLAFKGGGHNKFLYTICVWIRVTAPRAWWIEADQYKVFFITNSASSMHTLLKEPVTEANFAEGTSQCLIDNLNSLIERKASITEVKMNLPEGYLQTRIICTNYMTLQNIVKQREGHRLEQWKQFCSEVYAQLEHPEYIKSHTS